jgi:hypothetical protein
MGKLLYAILGIISLSIFAEIILGVTMPSSALVKSVIGLQNWGDETLLTYILGALGAVGLVGAIAGLVFIKQDWILYTGIGITFFSFGIQYVYVYQIINAKILSVGISSWVSILFMIPFFIPWLFILIEFPRGRDA